MASFYGSQWWSLETDNKTRTSNVLYWRHISRVYGSIGTNKLTNDITHNFIQIDNKLCTDFVRNNNAWLTTKTFFLMRDHLLWNKNSQIKDKLSKNNALASNNNNFIVAGNNTQYIPLNSTKVKVTPPLRSSVRP